MATLRAISGTGGKGPACFLAEQSGLRLMLDMGYGPQPGRWPDLRDVGRIDAVLLSHGHGDHAGGLALLAQVGSPPVYATGTVARMLPAGLEIRPLPLQGHTEVLGVPVSTGRSGHAPGGVWLHLGLGEGVLYMGDYSPESSLYDFDPPPAAPTVILDASYGDYGATLADCQSRLASLLDADLLLPVPEGGRGPDIALHLSRTRQNLPHIDDEMRGALQRLSSADRDCLRPGTAAELARLAAEAPPIRGPRGVMLASRADGTAGEAGRLIEEWERQAEPAIVFTGYLPPGTPAERLTRTGRARYIRWNVHPRLDDNAALARRVRARAVLPAFGDACHLPAWQAAFSPARVTLGETLVL